jgi:hypothetical protein
VASDRLSYHLDEHVPNAVAKALRLYGIDVTMPTDVNLLRARDHQHLEHARRTGRVMVTYDSDFLRLHKMNVEHAGIAYFGPRSRRVGYVIEMLCLFYEGFLPDEMINRLEYL